MWKRALAAFIVIVALLIQPIRVARNLHSFCASLRPGASFGEVRRRAKESSFLLVEGRHEAGGAEEPSDALVTSNWVGGRYTCSIRYQAGVVEHASYVFRN